jgi:hypothetical protein
MNQSNAPSADSALNGQATDAQIAEWKAKYKYGIYALEVDGHIGYFKNPDRNEFNFAMSKAESDKVLSVFEELANVTFIGGSKELLENDQMFIGISQELKIKMDGKRATLVNL